MGSSVANESDRIGLSLSGGGSTSEDHSFPSPVTIRGFSGVVTASLTASGTQQWSSAEVGSQYLERPVLRGEVVIVMTAHDKV